MNVARTVTSPNRLPNGLSARNRSKSRPAHRERDFGVGYGTSSGYARDSRYAESWAKLPFRCF